MYEWMDKKALTLPMVFSSFQPLVCLVPRVPAYWRFDCIFRVYKPNSKKVALGIGNWALGSYCLAVTQAKHSIVRVM